MHNLKASTLGASIAAALGAGANMPATGEFNYTSATGERLTIGSDAAITSIMTPAGVDLVTGQDVHSPVLVETPDGILIGTKASWAAGDAGFMFNKADFGAAATSYLLGKGFTITKQSSGAAPVQQ